MRFRKLMRHMAIAALGSSFILEGCNSTLRTTTENGIISTSQSLLTVFLLSIVEVAQEDAPA